MQLLVRKMLDTFSHFDEYVIWKNATRCKG